jgi:hypothetical protein
MTKKKLDHWRAVGQGARRSAEQGDPIPRHRIIKPKRIEKLFLLVVEPPHHAPLPSRIAPPQRNHRPQPSSTDFCNKICHKRICRLNASASSSDKKPQL